MVNNIPQFKHIDGETPMASTNTRENLAAFRFSQFYINNGDEDVFVVLRNNLPVRIVASNNGYRRGNEFIIRNVYSFNNVNIIRDTINNIAQIRKHYASASDDLKIISEILLNSITDSRGLMEYSAHCDIIIDRKITMLELKMEENVYVPELDTLLSFKSLDLLCPHPFSSEGNSVSNYLENSKRFRTSGSINVDIVDNENNISRRYLYAARNIIELNTIKDPTRESGVYVTIAKNGLSDNIDIKSQNYSLDDAEDKVGIYRTIEEAVSGGDPSEIHKRSIIELQQSVEREKHNRELSLLESKRVSDELTQEVERLKISNSTLKEESEKRKIERDEAVRDKEEAYKYRSMNRSDFFEERSAQRKDSNEIMKYAPAFIVGVVSAYGAYSTFNSKKKG